MNKTLIMLAFAGVLPVLSAAAHAERGGNGADIREARQMAAQAAVSASPDVAQSAPAAAAPESMRRPISEK